MNAPVKEILRHGEKRRIILNDGTTRVVTKQQLILAFNSQLQKEGRTAALKSIRDMGDMVSVKLGGVIKGERLRYKTIGAAKAAITRAYGKD